MKCSYRWIKDYVPEWQGSVDEMCERFTMSGTEVEGTEELESGDTQIEMTVTSNRVDCHGIAALARDFAAVVGWPFVAPDTRASEGDEATEDVCAVSIEADADCSRYTAMVIEGINVGPSPEWLIERLEAIGLRSINNVVDVTNFVLFELNQPFHAFDLDRVPQGKITVRRAKTGETIQAINDTEYTLDDKMTVIAGENGPLAIAGVMGGASSEVGPSTTRVLLETAAFDRVSTRRTSRKLGLNSDSSFRFERGTNDHAIEESASRCAKLIMEVAGGTLRKGLVDVGAPIERDRAISFRWAQVLRITGVEVPWPRCRTIFESLGCDVIGGSDPTAPIRVVAPTWRPDLTREIDLVEEVIRVHGLDALPEETGMRVRSVRSSETQRLRVRIKERLVGGGFSEILTTPFTEAKRAKLSFFAQSEPVTIRNAMRKEENALRQSLLPSLLEVRKTNQDRGNSAIRIFEISIVYLPRPEGGIPDHLPLLGGLLDGSFGEGRGALEAILLGLGVQGVSFEPLDDAGKNLLEDKEAARLVLNGETLGYLGRPLPAVAQPFKLDASPVIFELRIDRLEAASELVPQFAAFSKYPAVARDLAMIVDEERTWGEIEALVQGLQLPCLEGLAFFDEFRGKQIGAGKKSLAFSLTYRSAERTLTGEEVDGWQKRCVDALESSLGAQIRDK